MRSRTYNDGFDKYKKALVDINKAITLNTQDAENYYFRGCSYFNLKKYSDALEDFNKAITLNPNDAFYFQMRARTYHYGFAKNKDALKDFNQAITLNTHDAANYYFRGCYYFNLNKYSDALENFNKAIQLNSNIAEYFEIRGETYNDGFKNYKKALKDLNQAIGIKERKRYLIYRGALHIDLDNYELGINDWKRAFSLGLNESKAFIKSLINLHVPILSIKRFFRNRE